MTSLSHKAPLPATFALCLAFAIALAGAELSLGQSQDSDPGIQFVNMEVPSVLRHYEAWTGKRIIMDNSVASATITILTNEPMSDAEKAIFVEKSLLLNGYALIPGGENALKAVVVPGVGGQARAEGLEVFADPKDLPQTDRLVAYVMKFDHIGAESAAAALSAIFPPHGYGAIVPFPQASSVVITDNTATIRRYLDLKPHIDVQREDVPLSIKEFTLERGDATKVVEALNELLSIQSSGSSSSGKSGGTPPVPAGAPPTAAGGVSSAGNSSYSPISPVGRSGAQTLLQTESPDKARVQPKIRADTRTNKVLAVAEPKDMQYIETLIQFLDSPAPEMHYYTRKLNYLRVATLLDNLPNVLQRGLETGGANASTVAGGKNAPGTNPNSTNSSNQRNSYGNSSLSDPYNSGGMYGGSSGSSRRGSGAVSGFDFKEDPGPQSIVIDKTFVMVDNVQNRILASGPEEHLQLIDSLIEELDQEPKQIQISAVIASVALSDKLTSGLQLLRNVSKMNGSAGGDFLSTGTGTGTSSVANSFLNAVAAAPITNGLSFYGKLGSNIQGYLTALETDSRSKILARPTVYTQNGRLAVFNYGQRIPIQQNSYNLSYSYNSYSYENVVLEIQVMPLINSEDQITLNIKQVNDTIVGDYTPGANTPPPKLDTQELATTVVVEDGGTVLLGGYIREEDNPNTRNGVPGLVTLPLVGPLFGNYSREKKRSELMLFIQPRIIENAEDLAEAQMDVQARANSAPEVLEFAAPKMRAESEPANRPLLNRIFPKRPKQIQPEPTTNPTQPAPILNRRSNIKP